MPSNQGLATEARAGVKGNKSRISIVFCTNATGSDKMPAWVIGTARRPRSLQYANVGAMGITWRWNKKAWMTTPIMVEWLKAFYRRVGPVKQVLLTMDNFSVHQSAIREAPPPANIKIIYLPPNGTSKYQPLDQGIIQNFKALYKKHWLRFMVGEYEARRDPVKTVDLLRVIRWTTHSWSQVTTQTISNCFDKDTFFQADPDPQPTAMPDLDDLFAEGQRHGGIPDGMDLAQFNLPDEEPTATGHGGGSPGAH